MYAYSTHPEERLVPTWCQMLTAIPEVIFLIGSGKDDNISGAVNMRGTFGGHIYWLSFLFGFVSNISMGEYIENNCEGQKEKDLIFT